jgi:hypothetical protein
MKVIQRGYVSRVCRQSKVCNNTGNRWSAKINLILMRDFKRLYEGFVVAGTVIAIFLFA